MAITYSEDGSKKVRKGNKKAVNIAALGVGYPHSNVKIYTGVNIEDGSTYKRVLPNRGAAGYMGKQRPKGGV